jgi:hypothetical protein
VDLDATRPAVYKRTSLVPLYEITPPGEFGRFEIFDKAMEAAAFTAGNVGWRSSTSPTRTAASFRVRSWARRA